MGKLAPERLDHSGSKRSKRWWGGSGIRWATSKSFAPCYRQITMPAPHHSFFTGQKLFLMPNQQCQCTEGNTKLYNISLLLLKPQCIGDRRGRDWLGVVGTHVVTESRPELETVNE